ncbi:Heat shock protein 70-like protein LHS1 [Bienertia sinuspersici]
MSQALSTIPSISSISSLITKSSTNSSKLTRTPSPCLNVQMSMSPQTASVDPPINVLTPVPRRNIVALGIASAVLGLNYGEQNAWAAARRPPPAPPEEKQDPNISGVQAKVLASKKRKEAMKQAMAKQREKGKKIDETSSKNKVEETSKNNIEETSEKKVEESSDS